MSNFQPLEGVGRGNETHFQMDEHFNCITLKVKKCYLTL